MDGLHSPEQHKPQMQSFQDLITITAKMPLHLPTLAKFRLLRFFNSFQRMKGTKSRMNLDVRERKATERAVIGAIRHDLPLSLTLSTRLQNYLATPSLGFGTHLKTSPHPCSAFWKSPIHSTVLFTLTQSSPYREILSPELYWRQRNQK